MNIQLSQAQQHAVVAAVGIIAALFAGYWWLAQSTSLQPPAPAPNLPTAPAMAQATVLVDVQGDIKHPGVVELIQGARVMDAVAAAGGLLPGSRAGINLARLVVDGEQIVVGESPTMAPTDGKTHINTASISDLESLPGVGPVLAERIIAFRDQHGPFRNLAGLDAVTGVGPSMMSNLKDLISFD